jgi:NTE family protein
MAWDPAATRQRFQLAIGPAEKGRIEANFTPLSRTGPGLLYDADAVFEGGGVLGTAFLGAVRCCHDLGLRWHALAGTSAGAISATLLAADLPIDQLEHILGQLDYRHFLAKKTSRLIFNGDPGDDLDHPVQLLTNLAFARELGEYSTDPFAQWLDDALKWAGIPTFGDVWDRRKNVDDRQLKVVVSDITRGEMAVLPDDLEPAPTGPTPYRLQLTPKQRAFRVSEAVRLSMSIPFFFEPGHVERSSGPSTIVDGGILSNFPLWLFDMDTPGKPPEWPTFGFRLVDKSDATPKTVTSVTDLFSAMLKTMMLASDRRYLSQRHLGRVIDIDLTGLNLSATAFNLSNEHKDQLYARGYQSTKAFFLDQWSWPRHVKQRMGG